MTDTRVSSQQILDRVDGLRRRDGDWTESWEDAGARWGKDKPIDRSTFSHWKAKARTDPSFLPLPTLFEIARGEGVSLDWLIYGPGSDPEPSAYVLLDKLAEDIGGSLDRVMQMLPRPKRLHIVKLEPPGADPE